jgi:hypothetical protein
VPLGFFLYRDKKQHSPPVDDFNLGYLPSRLKSLKEYWRWKEE